MGRRSERVVVIGCGVSGLTSAIRLAEAGFRVRVVTRELPGETTSAVAAAFWHPYRVGADERVLAWSRRSLEVFFELARDTASGVVVTELVELFREPVADPWWRPAVRQFRRARGDELAPIAGGRYADGWVARVVRAETPVYLPWLVERLGHLGGTVEVRPRGVGELAELTGEADLLVHCTGLAARHLAGDRELYPIRGQVVLVDNPGLERALVDEEDPEAPSYIIPRRRDVVLGGTAEEGVFSTTPDPATRVRILESTRQLEPRLAGARLLATRVGLRPGRSAVRLEADQVEGTPIIHNYGHGGGGFTLSWGCAETVRHLAGEALGAR